jgi:nitrilase
MTADPEQHESTTREQRQERRSLRVAAVQATPMCFDRAATLEIVADGIARAGDGDADLVVFPESFVPGYPDWLWRTPPWSDPGWYERFEANAVDVQGDDLDVVRSAAQAAGTWVALGVTERGPSGSLYNSVVYIDDRGEDAGVHRKLVATGAERLVWANGQGPMLTVVDVHGVRVGTLICWEMYMPLARTAMYQQGIDVLLSPTWDNSDEWISTLRHTAKEGQVFVVGITAFLRGSDIPRDLPGAAELYGDEDDLMSQGNTTIVAPGGGLIAGPLIGEAGTLTADLDLGLVAAGRRMFDPVGHYSRPDVLSITIDHEGTTNHA